MCGISGILRLDGAPVVPDVLVSMTGCLSHRGPDDEGTQTWGRVGIGHRRLSIIDLEGGQQPLSNEDGHVWVTFNGEIYNYRDLRSELQAKGHTFRTDSDTEVIAHGYEEWGDQCVERFRGMFAFGVVDHRQHRLFLARDHLGIKPLYCLRTDRIFAFASELQAFQSLPDLELELDVRAIDQYLALQYIPAPRTAFRQVSKLLPAHRMSVSFDGQVQEPEEYWRLDFRPVHGRSEGEWLEALDDVLRESVRAHLVADVPFGAFLSGGVDSSAVVAYMAQIVDRPVRTFSIGFPEQEFSELRYAEIAARRWGTEHHTEIVNPDAMAILPELVRHYGEPFGDNSAIPTYYVSRLARSEVPMVLSGDGGDEAFAGYDTYRGWVEWLTHGNPGPAWRSLGPALAERILPGRVPRRSLKGAVRPFADRLLPWRTPRTATLAGWLERMTFIQSRERQLLWRPEHRAQSGLPLEVLEREFGRAADYSPSHQAQYIDVKSYLSSILAKVDVASMMHGLEVRTPLTDVKVFEFAATIPERLNLRANASGELEGKFLLKKLMARYYPPEFLHRRKIGFGMPTPKWLAIGSIHREAVRERLLGFDSPISELFEPSAVERMMDTAGWGPVWNLLVLDEWLRQGTGVTPSAGHPAPSPLT